MRAKTCPKCSGRMAEGALLVRDSNTAYCAGEWMEGAPTASKWGTGIKTKGRTVIPITSFRCERCGYLENYAERYDNPAPGS